MFRNLRRLSFAARPFRGRLIVSQVLLLIAACASLATAWLSQVLVNQGIATGDSETIIVTGFWMLIAAVVAGAAMIGAAYIAVFFSQGAAYIVRSMLYAKIQTFSFANFDQLRTGELLVRLSADTQNVARAVLYAVFLLLYAPFMLVIAFVLAIINSPDLVWLLVVTAVVVVGLMWWIVPRVFDAYAGRQERLDDLNNTMQENLAGIRVVKAFVREDLERAKFGARADAMQAMALQAAFLVAFLSPLLQTITQLGRAFAIWFGGSQVLAANGLDIGQLVAFTQYMAMVVTPLAMMAIVVPFILRGEASAARLAEVYDAAPQVVDRPAAKAIDPAGIKGKVVFENVSFAFPRPDGQLDPPVIRNINLAIEPGERVGILGATGAGKSALVNLLPRFYDVTEGRITIDGIDVRDFQQENLRQVVGIALQEAVLFGGDVRFNLKFGAQEVDDDVMIGAARAADAAGFVDNLPERYDAPVARRGYNFSGGQRQRLSMARALTPEPRVLVLDDSTSALDVATESRVQAAIPQFSKNVTTIYVAQRISAVIDLDKIVLMENGQIVDVGKHEELLARSPLYQGIYESQLGKVEGERGKGSTKDTKDTKDTRDTKDAKDAKDTRDTRDTNGTNGTETGMMGVG